MPTLREMCSRVLGELTSGDVIHVSRTNDMLSSTYLAVRSSSETDQIELVSFTNDSRHREGDIRSVDCEEYLEESDVVFITKVCSFRKTFSDIELALVRQYG